MAQFEDDSVVLTNHYKAMYSCSSFMIADFSTGNSILDIYQNGFSYIFRQTKSECAMHINASHIPVVLLCHKMSFRESESVK